MQDELAASHLEATDRWSRVIAELLLGAKTVVLPSPVRVTRPGDKEALPTNTTENPADLAGFFRRIG